MKALALGVLLQLVARSSATTAAPWAALKSYYESAGLSVAADQGVRLDGHPCCHHLVDEYGYTVVEQTDGRFVYGVDGSDDDDDARRDDMRRLRATPDSMPSRRVLMGSVDPRATPALSHLALSAVCARREAQQTDAQRCLYDASEDASTFSAAASDIGTRTVTTGHKSALVLMIRFADHTSRPLPSAADFDVLFNADAPHAELAPTGSVKQFYAAQSRGALNMTSVPSGWIDVPQTQAQAAMGCSGTCWGGLSNKLHDAIVFALDALKESGQNFSDFDADDDGDIDVFTVVHSGYGAEWGGTAGGAGVDDRIWSHKWSLRTPRTFDGVSIRGYNVNPGLWGRSGSAIGRLGVIAHEVGHFLGLPDLYDMTTPRAAPVGGLDVMSDSWGRDGEQRTMGSFGAWSRVQLGWAQLERLSASGTYELDNVQTSGTVYLLSKGYPLNEYLLIESRSNDPSVSVWDALNPAGIVVWHIDNSARSNGNSVQGYPGDGGGWPQNHLFTRVIQADNQFHFEKFGYWWQDSADTWRSPNQVLGDLTEPSLLSYKQLYQTRASCRTTGNTLSGFDFNNAGVSSFVYTVSDPNPCYADAPPDTGAPTPSPVTTRQPTGFPTTLRPSAAPSTYRPSVAPTGRPTVANPTGRPSLAPIRATARPSPAPVTARPSQAPSTPAPTLFEGETRSKLQRFHYCRARESANSCAGTRKARNWCTWNAQVASGGNTIDPALPEGCSPKFLSSSVELSKMSTFSLCTSKAYSRRSSSCTRKRKCFWNAGSDQVKFLADEPCLPLFLAPANK